MLSLAKALEALVLERFDDQPNRPGRELELALEFLLSHEGKKAETRCMTGRLASRLRLRPDPPLLSLSSPGGGITERTGSGVRLRTGTLKEEPEREGDEVTLLLGLWTLVLLLVMELAEGLLTQVDVELEVEKVVAVDVEMEEEEGEWMCLDEGLAFDLDLDVDVEVLYEVVLVPVPVVLMLVLLVC